MTKKARSIFLLVLPLALAVIISVILQFSVLTNQDAVTSWLSQFGPWVILAYALIQVITIVIAPIGGLFLQVALFALFDPALAIALIYLVATPTYCLNFFLARKYGRPLVQRIVGKTALNQIDRLAADAGTLTLIILKVFQGGIFDYLSYAIGLTKIPFKTFLIVNMLGGIPSSLVSYFILSKTENLTLGISILIASAYVLGGISIYLNHQLRKRKSTQQNS